MTSFSRNEKYGCALGVAVIAVILTASVAWTQSLVFPPYLHSYGIRKATPKHLFMFFGPRTFFNDPQGLAAARLESWDDPTKRGDDDEVVVYGVNAGRGEIIYNTSMWSLGLFGGKGSGKGQFLEPRGIAANGKGQVFVADSGNNRVVRLFNPKSSLSWIAAFSAAGTGAFLKGPNRIGIDEKVNIYVTDHGNRRIVVFDTVGNAKRIIPGPGSGFAFESGPTALAVADGSARWSYYNREQAIFCADSNGMRVLKLGFDGKLIARASMPKGHVASYGAVDYYHSFYVTDQVNHCIVKFDHDLKLVDIIGSRGEKDYQFIEPRGITIYKRFGQTFIAERKGAQYFWVGTECKKVSLKTLGGGRYSMPVTVTEHALISLFSTSGRDTITYFKRNRIPCGASVHTFSVEEGSMLKKKLTLKVEPTYSSFTHNAWYYPLKP
ncbi:MAG: NHL repeat-containing protein [Chitinispirillaceae bacterium]|nr:NHL repeat-containing protein [Chitinispirillaceae bacterium]